MVGMSKLLFHKLSSLLSLLLLLLSPTIVYADPAIDYFEGKCYNFLGKKVSITVAGGQGVPTVAAMYEGPGTVDPVILVNEDRFFYFSGPTRFFLLAHECAHHQLGHLDIPVPYAMAIEKQADCLAALNMKRNGIHSDQLQDIVVEVGQFFEMDLDEEYDRFHPSLNERRDVMRSCMQRGMLALKF